MQNTLESKMAFSHPRDQSLEAYKAWIIDIASRLTTDRTTLNMTEQEWIESWVEYWRPTTED